MGFNTGGGQKTYVKISHGKIARRCLETDAGAIACSNKDGTKKWFEQRFPSYTGFIKNVTKRKTEWGTDLCIDINDGSEAIELQMPWDSKYAKGFLKCMPNIDLSKQITFSPWMKEVVDNGKTIKKTMLYLSDGPTKEDQINWYWTKDNPFGLPEMKTVRVKGEDIWDDTEQMEYLEDHLTNTFLKRLAEAGDNTPPSQRSAAHDFAIDDERETIDNSQDDKDIPF